MKARSTSPTKADNVLTTAKENIKEEMLQQIILKTPSGYSKGEFTASIIKSHQNILTNT